MVKRMAFMLGLLGSNDEKPSRLRSALQMVLVGAVFLVGLVLPLVWVPYMALAFRKSGHQMGARAGAFYAERRSEEGRGDRAEGSDRTDYSVRRGRSDGGADRPASSPGPTSAPASGSAPGSS
jgi:hypothetical protein